MYFLNELFGRGFHHDISMNVIQRADDCRDGVFSAQLAVLDGAIRI
jgi:hypothetical protein